MKQKYKGEGYGGDYNNGYDKFNKAGNIISLAGMAVGIIGDGIASRNQKKAQKIIDETNKQYNDAAESLNTMVKATRKIIIQVVSLKKKIVKKNMKKFIKSYQRLNPQINLQDSQGLYELRKFMFSSEKLDDIQKQAKPYMSFNKISEKTMNTAISMVQEGTIANIVGCITFNTENPDYIDKEKIQNMSLIAERSVVTIVYGMSGITNAISSAKSIDDAKAYNSLCMLKIEKMKIKEEKIRAIFNYAEIHLSLLNRFEYLVQEYVDRSARIIKHKDNIFHFGRIAEEKFTQKELEVLAFTLSLVGAVKAIIDSPIISKDGDVFEDENGDFQNVQANLPVFEQQCRELRW